LGTASLLEAVLVLLDLAAKPKGTSEKLGFFYNIPESFTGSKKYSQHGREEESMHRKKLKIWGRLCPRAARASHPLGNREPSTVMLPARQGSIPMGASMAGPETAARFSQESQ